ncbi:MAG: outer membrane beta-barrel protein [Crocinitomicaceae bacterium]
MKKVLVFLALAPTFLFSQELNLKNTQGGVFSLGVRNTVSAFNGHENESPGFGVGGQFRLQFADRVNSDWFFDYITSDIDDVASRTDYHIGWSVLYYLTENPSTRLRPYLLAGHCFDYTIIEAYDSGERGTRFSSAVQAGAGVHFNLTPRLDLSFVTQYMLHLGNDLHAEVHNGHLHFHDSHETGVEGHLLFHLSINYKIADLW